MRVETAIPGGGTASELIALSGLTGQSQYTFVLGDQTQHPDGDYVINLTAVDAVLNRQGTPSTTTVQVDRTPPTSQIEPPSAGGPPEVTRDASITVDFSASDNLVGVARVEFLAQFENEGFNQAGIEEPFGAVTQFPYTFDREGEHRFFVRATDLVGNQEQKTGAEKSMIYDVTNPEILEVRVSQISGTMSIQPGITPQISYSSDSQVMITVRWFDANIDTVGIFTTLETEEQKSLVSAIDPLGHAITGEDEIETSFQLTLSGQGQSDINTLEITVKDRAANTAIAQVLLANDQTAPSVSEQGSFTPALVSTVAGKSTASLPVRVDDAGGVGIQNVTLVAKLRKDPNQRVDGELRPRFGAGDRGKQQFNTTVSFNVSGRLSGVLPRDTLDVYYTATDMLSNTTAGEVQLPGSLFAVDNVKPSVTRFDFRVVDGGVERPLGTRIFSPGPGDPSPGVRDELKFEIVARDSSGTEDLNYDLKMRREGATLAVATGTAAQNAAWEPRWGPSITGLLPAGQEVEYTAQLTVTDAAGNVRAQDKPQKAVVDRKPPSLVTEGYNDGSNVYRLTFSEDMDQNLVRFKAALQLLQIVGGILDTNFTVPTSDPKFVRDSSVYVEHMILLDRDRITISSLDTPRAVPPNPNRPREFSFLLEQTEEDTLSLMRDFGYFDPGLEIPVRIDSLRDVAGNPASLRPVKGDTAFAVLLPAIVGTPAVVITSAPPTTLPGDGTGGVTAAQEQEADRSGLVKEVTKEKELAPDVTASRLTVVAPDTSVLDAGQEENLAVRVRFVSALGALAISGSQDSTKVDSVSSTSQVDTTVTVSRRLPVPPPVKDTTVVQLTRLNSRSTKVYAGRWGVSSAIAGSGNTKMFAVGGGRDRVLQWQNVRQDSSGQAPKPAVFSMPKFPRLADFPLTSEVVGASKVVALADTLDTSGVIQADTRFAQDLDDVSAEIVVFNKVPDATDPANFLRVDRFRVLFDSQNPVAFNLRPRVGGVGLTTISQNALEISAFVNDFQFGTGGLNTFELVFQPEGGGTAVPFAGRVRDYLRRSYLGSFMGEISDTTLTKALGIDHLSRAQFSALKSGGRLTNNLVVTGPQLEAAGVTLQEDVTYDVTLRLFDRANNLAKEQIGSLKIVAAGTEPELVIYPNPFNPWEGRETTTIKYVIFRAGVTNLKLRIFDVAGRPVHVMNLDGEASVGEHKVRYDGLTASGETLSYGVYICELLWEENGQAHRIYTKMACAPNK